MKGCIALLAFMVVLAIGEYVLLRWTPMAGSIGLAALSSVLVALTVANVWGLVIWFKRRSALAKPAHTWRDGDLVGVSGRILSERNSIPAPASGVACAIYEYSLKRREMRTVRRGGSTRTETSDIAAFDGMAAAGCTVQGALQRYKLIGFPLLHHVEAQRLSEPDELERMAAYLIASEVRPKPAGVADAMRSLKDVLADADGVVRHDAGCYGAFDLEPYKGRHATDPDGARAELAQLLVDGDYWVEEKRIPEASEVTVYGSYRAADRSIDVGSGLDNVERGLALGNAAAVSGRDLRRTLLGLAFFGGIAGLLHGWLVPPLAKSFDPVPYAGRGVGLDDAFAARLRSEQVATRLVTLAQDDDTRTIALLLGLGANPDTLSSGTAPLRQAGEPETVRLFLAAGANPNVADHVGTTPLHAWTERGDLDTVKALLAAGAEPDAISQYGSTPLGVAATHGHLEIARALLDAGADPNARDAGSASPLDDARANGHEDVAQLLLEREAVETEVTARTGSPVDATHAAARLVDAYLAAVHAHDAQAIAALYVADAQLDWESLDWDAYASGRPARVEQLSGYANETQATLRVASAGSLRVGVNLERAAPDPADAHDGWRIAREWIDWK